MPTKYIRSKFPRSSTEAFPKTTAYACAVERPANSGTHAVDWAVLACAVAAAVVLSVWG
jgi:hypothetical protein